MVFTLKKPLSTQHPVLEEFLIDSLINYNTYLGYSRSDLDTKMSFDLSGTRRFIDIHNLNHTLYSIRTVLNLANTVLTKHGNIWLSLIGDTYLGSALGYALEDYITVWNRKWVPGLFSNRYAFLSLKFAPRFPTLMFYNRHTGNKERFKETSSLGILQSGIVDSNSDRQHINFLVNANEKSELTTEYFLGLFLNSATKFTDQNKINFLFKWEKN